MKYKHEILLAMGLRALGGLFLIVAIVALASAWVLALGGKQ